MSKIIEHGPYRYPHRYKLRARQPGTAYWSVVDSKRTKRAAIKAALAGERWGNLVYQVIDTKNKGRD